MTELLFISMEQRYCINLSAFWNMSRDINNCNGDFKWKFVGYCNVSLLNSVIHTFIVSSCLTGPVWNNRERAGNKRVTKLQRDYNTRITTKVTTLHLCHLVHLARSTKNKKCPFQLMVRFWLEFVAPGLRVLMVASSSITEHSIME